MKTIVTGEEMKLLDDNTSKVYGVPSVILMEQAAMGVVRELVASFSKAAADATLLRIASRLCLPFEMS